MEKITQIGFKHPEKITESLHSNMSALFSFFTSNLREFECHSLNITCMSKLKKNEKKLNDLFTMNREYFNQVWESVKHILINRSEICHTRLNVAAAIS